MTTSPATARTGQLRGTFLQTVDSLKRRRADLVSEALIADYVALYWLEWNGGTLQVTQTGRNVCDQLRESTRDPGQ